MGGSCYQIFKGPSWPWSYGSWDYLCNQCLSPLMLWVRIPIRARCTTLCDKVCQWLGTDRWFSPGPPVSSTNKADHHDITEILLKMAWNTSNKQTNKQIKSFITLCYGHLIFHWCFIEDVLSQITTSLILLIASIPLNMK